MTTTQKRRALTKRQQAIFDYVRDKILNRGYGPTVREIGLEFGIKSPNGVMCHLKALEKKGLITRESNMSRAIKLADTANPRNSVAFLGTASSGKTFQPTVSSEDRIEFGDLLGGADRAAVRISGSGFSSARISDGDFLILHREQAGEPGDVLVVLDDEHQLTLCRIPEDGGVPLSLLDEDQSAHRQILGVLAGVVRRFDIDPPGSAETNGTGGIV